MMLNKVFLGALLMAFCLFVFLEARSTAQDGGDDEYGPLHNLGKAPWLKNKKETKSKSDDQLLNDSPGGILGFFSHGLKFLSKVSSCLGTVKLYKDCAQYVIGLIDPSSKPASKGDIEALKKQLNKMNQFITNGFAQVLAGQEFLQVITIYTSYVDQLDYVSGTMAEFLDDFDQPDPARKDEFIKEVKGGHGKDSTEYALKQVNKMIEASGFFNSKGLYTALAEKMAHCKTCNFNINGMPLFASQFNTLQAGAYGALIAGLKAEGKTSDADSLEEKLQSRLENQVKLLVDAQHTFVKIAGSGYQFLKLRSSRGGCLDFQAQTTLGYHLTKCDEAPKWRVGKDGGLRIEKFPEKCVGTFDKHLASIEANCDTTINQWDVQISNKDPRYFRLKSRDILVEDWCVAANTRVVDGKPKVSMNNCGSLDDEAVIEKDQDNSFWEFVQ